MPSQNIRYQTCQMCKIALHAAEIGNQSVVFCVSCKATGSGSGASLINDPLPDWAVTNLLGQAVAPRKS